jgi:nucleotide-binding universal stress UspA family protein
MVARRRSGAIRARPPSRCGISVGRACATLTLVKQVLIATDGSDTAQEAVLAGLELVAEQGAEVTFLHVRPYGDYAYDPLVPLEPIVHSDAEAEQDVVLQDARRAARELGVTSHLALRTGFEIDTIVGLAEELPADLLVIGSRKRRGLRRLVLGSVSHGVVSKAKGAVLVVHPVSTGEGGESPS